MQNPRDARKMGFWASYKDLMTYIEKKYKRYSNMGFIITKYIAKNINTENPATVSYSSLSKNQKGS